MDKIFDSEFLAKFNHELRSPLHSIYGFGSLLLKNKGKRLNEQDIYFIQRILENCEYLFKLTDTFLEFVKTDQDSEGGLKLEDASVLTLVEDIFRMMEGQVLEKSCVLEADIPKDISPIRTDLGKLKIILINLIGNAIKHTEKGKIIVRAVSDQIGGKVKSIEVIDQGKGIPHQFINKIFDPFWSHDELKKSKGYGLGLYIVKSLCGQLGYGVEVESEEGKGSLFRIVIDSPADAP